MSENAQKVARQLVWLANWPWPLAPRHLFSHQPPSHTSICSRTPRVGNDKQASPSPLSRLSPVSKLEKLQLAVVEWLKLKVVAVHA